MEFEERLKLFIGQTVFSNLQLTHLLEASGKRVAELEAAQKAAGEARGKDGE